MNFLIYSLIAYVLSALFLYLICPGKVKTSYLLGYFTVFTPVWNTLVALMIIWNMITSCYNKLKNFFIELRRKLEPIKEFISVIHVEAKEKGGFYVTVKLTKEIDERFTGKREIYREVKLKNSYSADIRGQQFYFWDHECPEKSGRLSYDNGWCYLVTTKCEEYPWMVIYNQQVQRLTDEWLEKRGIKVEGSWFN